MREQAQSSADLSVDELWHIGTPLGVTEVRRADGIAIDATLLAQLSEYLAGLGTDVRPLPFEFLDLDGDGDSFDEGDYDVAEAANIARKKAGGVRDVWTWQHRDQLGGTTHVTDVEGELVSHQAFHPYGAKSARRGTVPALGYAGANDEVDADLGLLYFQARYYAPKLGRWISPDRYIGEDSQVALDHLTQGNLYTYVGNNPIVHVDETGNIFETVWDIANVAMDVASLAGNVATGNWGAAAVDAAGLAVDAAAVLLPGVPGGAGTAIKAARAADRVNDAYKASKKAANTAEAAKDAANAAKKAQKAAKTEKKAEAAKDAAKAEKPGKARWNSSDKKKAWKDKGRPDGTPPQREVLVRDRKTGERYKKIESKELHHKKPRREGGSNDADNLEEAWPSEHEAIDPHRHTGYDVIEVTKESI